MAAKVFPRPLKPKQSFILRVLPNSKLGQDLLQDATNRPKTIHQLVLEHFLTFLPKPGLAQPNQNAKETLVIMKDVSSNFQNRVQPSPQGKLLTREGIQQEQETVSLGLKADSKDLVVFEDLNVFHSQEECVSLDPMQEPPASEKEEDNIGEMVLMANDNNPEGENYREDSSDCDEMDCFVVSEKPPDCHKKKKNKYIHSK